MSMYEKYIFVWRMIHRTLFENLLLCRKIGERSMEKTMEFLHLYKHETKQTEDWLQQRLQQLTPGEPFWPTSEELAFGAKVAWRNSNKCIGRFFWRSLQVFDARDILEEEAIFLKLLHHIEFASNGGKIRPTITVFHPQKVRIHNHQLIRYAGYEQQGNIIGDPQSVAFTKKCIAYGWQPKYGEFDVLPLMIQVADREPRIFEIPPACVLEVPITHPQHDFEQLQLKWYAVPMIADMKLDVGDVSFQAAPFNGWYMGTEIGARNLADTTRYNRLPQVAEVLQLDTSAQATLWKDRALVELNIAVLHSFKQHGVSIVDHHTAATQFQMFEQQEQQAGRDVTGNWAWLIPPMSPAATHVFHQPYTNERKSPNYVYQ